MFINMMYCFMCVLKWVLLINYINIWVLHRRCCKVKDNNWYFGNYEPCTICELKLFSIPVISVKLSSIYHKLRERKVKTVFYMLDITFITCKLWIWQSFLLLLLSFSSPSPLAFQCRAIYSFPNGLYPAPFSCVCLILFLYFLQCLSLPFFAFPIFFSTQIRLQILVLFPLIIHANYTLFSLRVILTKTTPLYFTGYEAWKLDESRSNKPKNKFFECNLDPSFIEILI